MQKYDSLRTMRLQAPKNTDLSSVYGHAISTFTPLSDKVVEFVGNSVAQRRARRWAAQAQTLPSDDQFEREL